jgi:predicted transcriptional regulator
MIAKELMEKYHMKQVQAAKFLRVSQPAISLYRRKIRGKAIDLENDKDINSLIHQMTEALVQNKPSHKDLVQTYCKICRTIRAKGLLCKIHKKFDHTPDTENCELCKATDALTRI